MDAEALLVIDRSIRYDGWRSPLSDRELCRLEHLLKKLDQQLQERVRSRIKKHQRLVLVRSRSIVFYVHILSVDGRKINLVCRWKRKYRIIHG